MTRKPLISGNWKMHLTHLEAIRLMQELSHHIDKETYDKVDVSVHPPFSSLRPVQIAIGDMKRTPISLGAQDCHFEKEGAYTGEVSAPMLAALDVEYVIVGHSERRQHFGESDELAAQKLKAIWDQGMTPILAVGETSEEKQEDRTEEKITMQIQSGLEGSKAAQTSQMVIAYEPVWAIGSAQPATAKDAGEVAGLIRGLIRSKHGKGAAESIRVQYGGSVKPINISEFMKQPDIDGALVGGASLNAKDFGRIIRFHQAI